MPERSYSSPSYRYGFQGQEKDDEVKGEGNSVNYKYRMHDPRLGRFFAVDPLASKYPYYSPYAFSGNRVIDAVELEGLEPQVLKDLGKGWSMFGSEVAKIAVGTAVSIKEGVKSEYQQVTSDPKAWAYNKYDGGRDALGHTGALFSSAGTAVKNTVKKEVLGQPIDRYGYTYYDDVANEFKSGSEYEVMSKTGQKMATSYLSVGTTLIGGAFTASETLFLGKSLIAKSIKSQINKGMIRTSLKATTDQALTLGKDFVGKGYTVKKFANGKIKELYSADGTKRFRLPQKKADGRFDANFERLKSGVDPTVIKGQKNPWKNNKNYTNTHVGIK